MGNGLAEGSSGSQTDVRTCVCVCVVLQRH